MLVFGLIHGAPLAAVHLSCCCAFVYLGCLPTRPSRTPDPISPNQRAKSSGQHSTALRRGKPKSNPHRAIKWLPFYGLAPPPVFNADGGSQVIYRWGRYLSGWVFFLGTFGGLLSIPGDALFGRAESQCWGASSLGVFFLGG